VTTGLGDPAGRTSLVATTMAGTWNAPGYCRLPTGYPAAGERVLAGRYRLEQPRGSDAGIQFLHATDQRDGRPVGITLFTGRLDADRARRFLDQARPLTAVHHPDLVTVLDIATSGFRRAGRK
jgi:hypothetical protein